MQFIAHRPRRAKLQQAASLFAKWKGMSLVQLVKQFVGLPDRTDDLPYRVATILIDSTNDQRATRPVGRPLLD